jgi:hypothetical protein
LLMTLFSMFSYDGMVVAPIIVLLIALSRDRSLKWPWMTLALIPLYLWMRQSAGALAPQGDYGYKLTTVFVNGVANGIGYMVAAFGGPKFIEFWQSGRAVVRPYMKEFSLVVVVAGLVLVWFIRRARKSLHVFSHSFVWLLAFFISLVAYAPLGGMADRYTYIPSLFLTIGLILFVTTLWEKSKHIHWKLLIILGFIALVVWNIKEVSRLGDDWIVASQSAEQTLLVIKKETFPPKDVKTFFFVNTPIKYGSAWIFPTGLNDAIWHMYRQSPYRVFAMPTIEDAYKFPMNLGDREVFVFEDYKLKRGVQQVDVVPTPKNKK